MEENKSDNIPMQEFQKIDLRDGSGYKTLLPRKYLLRKNWKKSDPSKVISFIPGTIRNIYVQPGQTVAKGDRLCSLEAMKMCNNIYAPVESVVKTIHVKTGENVANKQLLIELET